MKCFICNRILRLMTVVSILLSLSCSSGKKISNLKKNPSFATLSLPYEDADRTSSLLDAEILSAEDTVKVISPDGEEVFIMDAIREENGEMVATSRLQAAVVTAKFRNVAERHGKVRLEFVITVPEELQDTRWQLRFTPSLVFLQDSTSLERVVVTGEDYRRRQLKGYQQYERFLSRIITDSTSFLDIRSLELFLMRNIPQIYAFRNDSTEVSDDQFESVFGVDEKEAIQHYTDHLAILNNLRRIGLKDKMYNRFVKAPISTDGVRLDTVLRTGSGDFEYCYIYEMETRPSLRKASVYLSGEILENGEIAYVMPQTEPLTYYISSLSAFVDDSPRYLDQVIERRAQANTACYIDFGVGKSQIDTSLGHNNIEVGRIRENLSLLAHDEVFDIDSIVVTSYASPEGSVRSNEMLSLARARATSEYFEKYLEVIRMNDGFEIDLDESDIGVQRKSRLGEVKFFARSCGENWTMLDHMISIDTLLSDSSKKGYFALSSLKDYDERERKMQKMEDYPYLRTVLYPRLRIVKFAFHLHRKGMVKDTVHTTVIDENYARGVRAIKDRDYETAIKLLAPYHDYNLAVAYCAADRNVSAMDILSKIPETSSVLYMKAVLFARMQNVQKAVQCYLDACRLEPSFVHRGNLDPEISTLIRRYGLNEQ